LLITRFIRNKQALLHFYEPQTVLGEIQENKNKIKIWKFPFSQIVTRKNYQEQLRLRGIGLPESPFIFGLSYFSSDERNGFENLVSNSLRFSDYHPAFKILRIEFEIFIFEYKFLDWVSNYQQVWINLSLSKTQRLFVMVYSTHLIDVH
jgi:hypothetical protein